MGAAEQRVAELLERWLASVELHARYLALDDEAYARVQDWPKHQRPSRWVVDLARKRLLELKRLLADRQSRGDQGFAEALELMAFLTNLLGSEHVERFIPLAQPASGPAPADATPAAAVEPTVKSPALKRPRAAAEPEPTVQVPATKRPATRARRATAAPSAPSVPTAPATRASAAGDKATATVIADAVRLLSWGREWPQLAGLIARLADRPPEAEVWKILRTHRAAIEARARQPRG